MPDKRKNIQQERVFQPASMLELHSAGESAAAHPTRQNKPRGRTSPVVQAADGRVLLARPLEKIISGGQTGTDRAALDFAMVHNVPHGGWCPRGRLAEDGALEERYELKETPDPEYPQRTEWNVRDSDATVIFSIAPKLAGGSKLTKELAARLGKPCLHLSHKRDGANAVEALREFIRRHNIRVLNVAGPRASNEPAVPRFVLETLEKLFKIPKSRLRSWDRYN